MILNFFSIDRIYKILLVEKKQLEQFNLAVKLMKINQFHFKCLNKTINTTSHQKRSFTIRLCVLFVSLVNQKIYLEMSHLRA